MPIVKRPPLYLLTGCTACGKTELSLAWAEAREAEIISCDSLLFYRGMDIGTAKPDLAERARVPHHLVDILEPTERMDVKQYTRLARAAIERIETRGRPVLVVGGSGFYLKSYFAAVADDVAVEPGLRAALETDLREHGLEKLVRRLSELNPAGLADLDIQNPRRVLRALERCLSSGRTMEELASDFAKAPPPFADREIRIVELTRESTEIRKRIRARAEAMLKQGLVEEVRELRSRGFEGNPTVSSAVGYRDVLGWLDQGLGTEALLESIATSTWRLARKQRTWFRNQLPPHRVVALSEDAAADADGLFV